MLGTIRSGARLRTALALLVLGLAVAEAQAAPTRWHRTTAAQRRQMRADLVEKWKSATPEERLELQARMRERWQTVTEEQKTAASARVAGRRTGEVPRATRARRPVDPRSPGSEDTSPLPPLSTAPPPADFWEIATETNEEADLPQVP